MFLSFATKIEAFNSLVLEFLIAKKHVGKMTSLKAFYKKCL